jgi:hypothetical protein
VSAIDSDLYAAFRGHSSMQRDASNTGCLSYLACPDGPQRGLSGSREPKLKRMKKGLDTVRKTDIRFATTVDKLQILNANQFSREHEAMDFAPYRAIELPATNQGDCE